MNKLTDYHVQQIRTQKLTDSFWSRRLRVSITTIYHARIGKSYKHVAAAPDTVPRDGTGRNAVLNPAAKAARTRRDWL